MLTTILNGAQMTTRAQAHDEIARSLNFPGYYGKNLDALWDCASTLDGNAVLINPAPMLNALGSYGCQLLQTLYEAAEQNPRFSFHVQG